MLIAIKDDKTILPPEGSKPVARVPANLPEHQETNDTISSPTRKGRRRAAKVVSTAGANTLIARPQPAQGTRLPAESKTVQVLKLLRQEHGATLSEISAITAWQAHSVRGFLSGTVRKKLGLNLISEISDDGVRQYRIDHGAARSEPFEPSELPPFGPFKGAPTVEKSATECEH